MEMIEDLVDSMASAMPATWRSLLLVVVLQMTACTTTRPRVTVLASCASETTEFARMDTNIGVPAHIDVIEIVQSAGSVFVRPGPADRIEMHAVVQCLSRAAGAVTVASSARGKQLQIDIGFAGRKAEREWLTSEGRADVTLWLPVDRALRLRTSSGEIEVRGAENGVTANSTSGDIHVAAGGSLQLTSESGNIIASQRDTRKGHESTLQTAANISANVLSHVPVVLAASTCGEIDSDLVDAEQTIDAQGCARLAWAQRAATDAPKLRIVSGHGRVIIRAQAILAAENYGTNR